MFSVGKMAPFICFVVLELFFQYVSHSLGWGSANSGFSFGLGQGLLPGFFYLMFAFGLLYFVIRRGLTQLGWWLIVAGGLANGAARVFFGQVWDYFHWDLFVPLWFNLADVSITLGVALALWSI